MSIKGKVAIVGVAESDSWYAPDLSPVDMMAKVAKRALDEAGIDKSEVDGLFSASSYYYMSTLTLGEYLGIVPRYTDSTSIGGSSFVSHLLHAAAAISAGLCNVALICYGSTQRSDSGKVTSLSEKNPFEEPFGLLYPLGSYALAARRHMAQYGTTSEQLAEVAVAARKWAMLHPKAFMREPITIQDVLNSPMVSSPLHKLDCCLVTDGAGAVVLTSAERARSLKQKPVYLLGVGESHFHRWISSMPDLTETAAKLSGEAAYKMAGVTPSDVDLVMLYDAFTINVILFLEDLGFWPKGEGGAFVTNGRIAPGGELPVNTNGGGLSYCHPGMFGIFLIIEAVRQLRGEAGERQLRKCDIALVHGNGGTLSSQTTAILSKEPS
ncbi:thiolase [Parageobacillus thermoglucosidasius]|uniref:thiolase n=1 Tax=Parageobacillus thermoglucosidasius TaxID=1426 RepID=UPI000B56CF24|nr:thiolase [Parageobacillus thermoglucosidasius]OUM92065.1 MAG: thiolase [Parageobacillus thermoglucosidasius]